MQHPEESSLMLSKLVETCFQTGVKHQPHIQIYISVLPVKLGGNDGRNKVIYCQAARDIASRSIYTANNRNLATYT